MIIEIINYHKDHLVSIIAVMDGASGHNHGVAGLCRTGRQLPYILDFRNNKNKFTGNG